MKNISGKEAGFTLMELIVTITVASVMAAFLVVMVGQNIINSVNPVNMVKDQNKLVEVMDKITNDYKQQVKNGTLNLSTFAATVTSTYNNVDGISISTSSVNYDNGTGAESDCSSNCKNLKIIVTGGGQSTTSLFTQ